MRHAPAEDRAGLRGLFVHVCVEVVAGEVREMLDILERDRARTRLQRVARLQLAEAQAERVHRALVHRRAGQILAERL